MKKLIAFCLFLSFLLGVGGVAFADKLIIGTEGGFPPFEFIGDDGKVQGFDIDLINAVLDAVSLEHEIVVMDFDALITALDTKQIDIAVAGMTITEERKQQVLFSDPYFDATQKLIVKEGSAIKSEKDITANMKVGVQLGTTGDIYVTDNLPCECVRFIKALDAVLDLKNGRLDAVLADEGPSAYLAQSVGSVVVLEENLSDEQYGIAVRKDENELLKKINEGLGIIKQNGTYEKIHNKYFGQDQ